VDRLRATRFAALVLAALGLALGGAHVLELPVKMAYEPELYARVTGSLYRWFGSVGALIQIAALVSAGLLCFLVRGRPSFRATLCGVLGLLLSLILWAVFVAPVNAEWARVIAADPGAVPDAYARLRTRWEYGHVAAFAAWLVGFGCLVGSVVAETPGAASEA
jgi:hypothetical protein